MAPVKPACKVHFTVELLTWVFKERSQRQSFDSAKQPGGRVGWQRGLGNGSGNLPAWLDITRRALLPYGPILVQC